MSHATRPVSSPRLWIGLLALVAVWGFLPSLTVDGPGSTPSQLAPGAEPAGSDASPWAAADAALSAIEATIGQLQTADETALREPLLGMRRDQLEFQAAPDPRYARQFSWWAETFSIRLAGRAIPEGTRMVLAFRLAAYQHGALGTMDAILAARRETAAIGDTASHSGSAIRPAT